MSDQRKLTRLKRYSLDLLERIDLTDPALVTQVTGSGLTYSDLMDKLDSIRNCATVVELKGDWKPAGAGTLEQVLTVSAANYCRQHAVCPVCAERMQARRRARFDRALRRQAEMVRDTRDRIDGRPGDRYAYLMTFTVADGPDLGERLEHLKRSVRNWRRMGQRRKGKRSHGEAGKVVAGLSTVEIKRGEGSGMWHAHAHALVFSDSPLDYRVYDADKRAVLEANRNKSATKEELASIASRTVFFQGREVPVSKMSNEWYIATGGDSIGIDVAPLRHIPRKCSERKKQRCLQMTFVESLLYQMKEALKYPAKIPADRTTIDFLTVLDKTYNKRMTSSYGEFRGVPGDDYTDPAADDQEKFVLVWDQGAGEYGKPVPGDLRTIDQEKEHETRSMCGRITGEYRRARRAIVEARDRYGTGLCQVLDNLKTCYRRRIRKVWGDYRNIVDAENRMAYNGCDKYSPILSPMGICLVDVGRRELAQAAF